MKLLRTVSPLYVTSLALGAESVVLAPAGLAGDREARWSCLGRTSVAFSKQFECFAECGFNLDDVQMVAAGPTFRF